MRRKRFWLSLPLALFCLSAFLLPAGAHDIQVVRRRPQHASGPAPGPAPDPDCTSGSFLPDSIFCDDFNRSDTSDPLGTSTSGHTWISGNGTWGVQSNRAGSTDTTANPNTYWDSGQSDVLVQATMSDWGNGNEGLIFRRSDNSNWVYVYQSGSSLIIGRRTAGSNTNAGSASYTAVDGDVLKVQTDGQITSAWINGAYIRSLSQTQHVSNTQHGIGKSNTTAALRVDDYSIRGRAFQRYVPTVAGYTVLLDPASPPGIADGENIDVWANRGSVAAGYMNDTGGTPTFQTNELNGLPIAEFVAGESDALRANNNLSTADAIDGTDYTFFFVVRPDNTGDSEASNGYWKSPMLAKFSATGQHSLTIGLSNQKFTVHHNASGGNNGSTVGASFLQSANYTVGQWYILEVRYGANLMTLRTNCSTTVTNASGTDMGSTSGQLGIGVNTNGGLSAGIALVVGYDSDIGSTNADTICSELQQRFGL